MSIFGKSSGYRWMDVYVLANIVELGTDRFCDDFLNFKNDPGGRTFGQMNHAARSGCRNLAEGSERLAAFCGKISPQKPQKDCTAISSASPVDTRTAEWIAAQINTGFIFISKKQVFC